MKLLLHIQSTIMCYITVSEEMGFKLSLLNMSEDIKVLSI